MRYRPSPEERKPLWRSVSSAPCTASFSCTSAMRTCPLPKAPNALPGGYEQAAFTEQILYKFPVVGKAVRQPGPYKHGGLRLLHGPAQGVEPFHQHIAALLVRLAGGFHAALVAGDGGDGGLLDGQKHAVIQVALQKRQAARQRRGSPRKTRSARRPAHRFWRGS